MFINIILLPIKLEFWISVKQKHTVGAKVDLLWIKKGLFWLIVFLEDLNNFTQLCYLKYTISSYMYCCFSFFFIVTKEEAHWQRYRHHSISGAGGPSFHPKKHPLPFPTCVCYRQGPQPLHWKCLLQVNGISVNCAFKAFSNLFNLGWKKNSHSIWICDINCQVQVHFTVGWKSH